MYVRVEKFFYLRQRNILVREFSTKLNSLAKYALDITSSQRNKLDMFMRELRPDITKVVMMRENPPKTFLEALAITLGFETIR